MQSEQVQLVDQAITSRHSVRAFYPPPLNLKSLKIFWQSQAVHRRGPTPSHGKCM